jgi:hypothetical protein
MDLGHSATGFSPFFLVHGSEEILPIDVTFGVPLIQVYNTVTKEKLRKPNALTSTSSWNKQWKLSCGKLATTRNYVSIMIATSRSAPSMLVT